METASWCGTPAIDLNELPGWKASELDGTLPRFRVSIVAHMVPGSDEIILA